jgi:hypothetical protein
VKGRKKNERKDRRKKGRKEGRKRGRKEGRSIILNYPFPLKKYSPKLSYHLNRIPEVSGGKKVCIKYSGFSVPILNKKLLKVKLLLQPFPHISLDCP